MGSYKINTNYRKYRKAGSYGLSNIQFALILVWTSKLIKSD